MKEIKIYIETSLCGPGTKDGWYAAIIEYITERGPAIRGIVGMEKGTTYYRSVLLATIKALERLTEGCDVKIYTGCGFVKNMVEKGNLDNWKKNGWQKPGGGGVENRELWQQFAEQMEIHKIEFRFSRHHIYRERLQKEIAEIKGEQGRKCQKSP